MSNDLALLGDMPNIPAHLQAAFGNAQNSELSSGVSGGYAVLSIKGKTWALAEGGDRTVIMRPDGDGPVNSIEVVIIKANPHLSKVYYDGGYTEGSDAKPLCYSNDSIAPAGDAQAPQCASCALCPHNQWGSRITENGSKGKACSDSRRIAVVPSGQLDHLMLLRVPAATLKDLSVYADALSRRNAPYQAVVTKIGFDPDVAHPKLTFKATRWLEANEAKTVVEVAGSDLARQIVGATDNGAHVPAEVASLPPRPVGQTPRVAPVQPRQAPVQAPVQASPPANTIVPRGAFGGVASAAAPAVATIVESTLAAEPKAKAPRATKKGAFSSEPAPAKQVAPATKAAVATVSSDDDLDAALAELDDMM